ncbi:MULTISPECIES: tRNA (adenine(22)-N(1))-methyltransferase TrmK [Listeria]|uniref:tRNA (adenine(22)-N(1))-methyltransferase n=1 Tax=Listeria TaxID=1637 RepID=UPI000B594E41|nr:MULTISPECIES: tRNA (adenine(22)-N(1))-methyltransferase TrmK [Listeria]
MNEQKLSNRLTCVANYIPKGSRIADIGSDHAYLPCYAILNEIASFAVAGEVAKGPFESAQEQVIKAELSGKIDVRFGDGLAVITSADAIDTVVIAGMGGTLIRTILEAEPQKLTSVRRLILQPNIGAWQIREWAENNYFKLISEAILREDNKTYEILVLEKTERAARYTDKERLLGPFLLTEKNDVFVAKWQHELANWQRIVAGLQNGQESEQNADKMKELTKKIQLVEEVLK